MTAAPTSERTAEAVVAVGALAWAASLGAPRPVEAGPLGPAVGPGPGPAAVVVVVLWAAAVVALSTWARRHPPTARTTGLGAWAAVVGLGGVGLAVVPLVSRPAGGATWLVVVGGAAVVAGGLRGLAARARSARHALGGGPVGTGPVEAEPGAMPAPAPAAVGHGPDDRAEGLAVRVGLGGAALMALAVVTAAAWGLWALDLDGWESVAEGRDDPPTATLAMALTLVALAVVAVLGWWTGRAPTDAPGWERGTGPPRLVEVGLAGAGAAAVALLVVGGARPSGDDLRAEPEVPLDLDAVVEGEVPDCCLDHAAIDDAGDLVGRVLVPLAGGLFLAGATVSAGAAAAGARRVRGGGTRRPG